MPLSSLIYSGLRAAAEALSVGSRTVVANNAPRAIRLTCRREKVGALFMDGGQLLRNSGFTTRVGRRATLDANAAAPSIAAQSVSDTEPQTCAECIEKELVFDREHLFCVCEVFDTVGSN